MAPPEENVQNQPVPQIPLQTVVFNDLGLAGVKAPEFDWHSDDLPGAFKKFKRYCQLMLSTPTYASRSPKERVNYILLWLGPQGVEIFDSWTHLTPVQLDDPEQVWTAFSNYFEPKTNYRLARYQLRDIRQNSNEPVDSYISRLRTQAKKCNYQPDALEDMLIDQFIVGVAHDSVHKHILDKKPDELTLDMCLQFARTHEATASQFGQFQSSSVASVKHTSKRSSHHKDSHKSSRSRRSRSKSPKKKSCVWCGGEQHDRANCPAADSQCSKCKKLGHWSQACLTTKYSQAKYSSQQHQSKRQQPQPQPRQRAVHETQENLTAEFKELNFHAIETSSDGTQAHAKIRIEAYPGRSTNLHGKIDTGSQGNILPLRTYLQIYPQHVRNGKPINTTPSETVLTAYNGTPIKQHRYITLPCTYKNKTSKFRFYIADTNSSVIFGLDMCIKLGIVELNYNINTEQSAPIRSFEQVVDEYPDRFSGIGKLPGKYSLVLQENTKPTIHAPRRAPIQLREKIQAELERMIKLEVIRPVTEPTDWVSSLTYVLKSDDSLHICLDPSDLNRALKRGQHHILTIDELAHKFRDAKYFSKLDARSGYWSILLDEKSQLLTTFNTPFGRHCFIRLPFGLIGQEI